VIIRGSEKERFEFYLVIKPLFNLIFIKKAINSFKILIRAIKSLIYFSLPRAKEKSLYNIPYPKNLKAWGGLIGTLLR